MKTINSATIIVALFFLFNFSAKAQIKTAEVQVSGLTCSMCQLATQKSLKTIDYIADIKPDLNKNIYVLTFKKDKPVDLDLIKKKVKDAGFSVSKMIITLNLNNVAISNDFHYKYAGELFHFMDVPAKILNGDVRLTVIGKDFIPAGEYKKYSTKTALPCYKTGVMGDEKVVHVTI